MASSTPKRAGRPRSEGPKAHAAIMDAAYLLLQRTPLRDLTMEAIAGEAGVGKATLYKWWPSKVALVFAMFHERLDHDRARLQAPTPEDAIRARARRLVAELDGLFGKAVVELIAEAQSEPAFLREFYERYVAQRRAEGIAWIEEAQAAGTLRKSVSPAVLVDQIYGAIYYRRLLGIRPLDRDYADQLVTQVLGAAGRLALDERAHGLAS